MVEAKDPSAVSYHDFINQNKSVEIIHISPAKNLQKTFINLNKYTCKKKYIYTCKS